MTRLLSVLLAAFLISACGSDSADNSSTPATTGNSGSSSVISGGSSAPKVAVAESRAGTIYRQEVMTSIGETMVIQVFEPTQLEAGKTYPLVLHAHGYGGTRYQEPNDFVQKLIDTGYYVISIDQRGHGESSGTIRAMSPDFNGLNLVSVLDWAEDLEGLARRENGEMYVGSYGSSYGGMYQLMLHSVDPKHRLRVMAPDISPHDLNYSLNPYNVVKSGWDLALLAGGEVPLLSLTSDPVNVLEQMGVWLQRGSQRQDPVLFELLVQAAATNDFDESGENFFKYHSTKYFCDGEPAGPQSFNFADADPLLAAPGPLPAADVLLTQGMLDGLFNFNNSADNYDCLKANGGDVRLLTHQSGHILPVSSSALGAEDPMDPFYQALTVPEFQDGGGSRSCGSLNLTDMQFAWFEEKLRGQKGAIDAVLTTGQNICMSLEEGDAIEMADIKRGGESFAIEAGTPQFNSLVGVVGSLLGTEVREAVAANIPLYTAPEGGAIVAGIPMLNVDVTGLSGQEQDECPAPLVSTGCDPIFYLGVGHRPAGQSRWEPLDDQITPIRGFGTHSVEMNGVAERLAEGDELSLIIYAFHAQFPVTWSRDVLVPATNIAGELQIPILSADEVLAEDIITEEM